MIGKTFFANNLNTNFHKILRMVEWEAIVKDTFIFAVLQSIDDYRKELEELAYEANEEFDPKIPNYKLFEQAVEYFCEAFESPEYYTGLLKSDITYKTIQEPFLIKVVADYSPAGGPIIIKTILESTWEEKYDDDLSELIEEDNTSMDNFLNFLNYAVCEVNANSVAENLEKLFDWKYIKKGIPFEGLINLEHYVFGEEFKDSKVIIPSKVEIREGPQLRVEFLVREWK